MKGIKAGTGGNRYVPYAERTGNESIVYFTRDLSPEGMVKVYERVKGHVLGRVAIKLHTGEPHGPNIIPPQWVKAFMEKELPGATIVVASVDILAADQASVDMIAAMSEEHHHDLIERIESRHGYRQLSYMKELGMGNDRYVLIDTDNGDRRIDAQAAVEGVVPFAG